MTYTYVSATAKLLTNPPRILALKNSQTARNPRMMGSYSGTSLLCHQLYEKSIAVYPMGDE